MKKFNPWVVFGIVLVVIAIIVLIVFLLFVEEKAAETDNGPTGSLQPARPEGAPGAGNLSRWASKNGTNVSWGTAMLMRARPAA